MAINSSVFTYKDPVDDFKKVVDRSLYGPETMPLSKLKVDGHYFIPKPITWYRPAVNGLDNSGELIIKGQLIHWRSLLKDQNVFYNARVVNGKIVEKNLGVTATGGWKDAAHRIVETIINDAVIDFSAEFNELDPGKKEYVTFYEHSDFKGKSIKLGVGQYANRYFPDKGWNDKISSIKVPPGFVVHVYKGDGLREYSGEVYVTKMDN